MMPNYLYFAEQVSHHPPISAAYASSDSYDFWMNTSMKTTFWGKSLEVKPFGLEHVRLKATGEHFTIERPNTQVNNLIFGEMYVEHSGVMTVKNVKSNERCEIDFKKRGWSGKGAYEVEGYLLNAAG
jgi:Oxysterol-binding protein